jgi:hypothetical protein
MGRLGQSHPCNKQSTWYHVPSKQVSIAKRCSLFHHHHSLQLRHLCHSSPPRDPSLPAGHFANATFPLEVASSDRQPGLTRPDTARGAIPWLMTSGGRSANSPNFKHTTRNWKSVASHWHPAHGWHRRIGMEGGPATQHIIYLQVYVRESVLACLRVQIHVIHLVCMCKVP